GEGIAVPPLVAAERLDVIPLSFAQESMWFLDQLDPGSTAYLVPRAYRLYGGLDARSLEQAFNELIQRHEGLRTTFPQRDGEVVQMIHRSKVRQATALLPVVDLQRLEPLQREQEAQRLARQEAQHPCDLAKGPLLRLFLLRLVTGQTQGK